MGTYLEYMELISNSNYKFSVNLDVDYKHLLFYITSIGATLNYDIDEV
jgi:hypothetical protein